MKKFYNAKTNLLIVAFVLTITLGHSQNYDFSASMGTFVPVTGGTNLSSIQTDDILSSAIPIGFTFNYFGNNFTQVKASSNGVLTFDPLTTSYFQFNFMAGYGPNIIAPLWDDLSGDAGVAKYVTSGIAPNRVFTMEWLNWKWTYQSSIAVSFQVKLYETTNRIEFIYRGESGPLQWPSASIGIVGANEFNFYSLANASASPSLDPNGFNAIDSKPATGQTYSFSPSGATIVSPTTQASNVVVSNNVGDAVTIGWTNGNGAYRTVFMKQTNSGAEMFTPVANASYQGSDYFGNHVYGANWSCVYNGSGSTVTVEGLESGKSYRIQVTEYNGLGGNQKYLSTAGTNNPINVTTIVVPPESPFSELNLVRVSGSEASVKMLEGSGSFKAVFLKQGATTTLPLINTTTYSANSTFGLGSEVGSSGWYCVYNGPGFSPPLNVLGLSPNTTYSLFIADYNGAAGFELYNTIPTAENTLTFTTLINNQIPTYDFTTSTATFTPIVGGTSLDAIEDDEGIETEIPIGFTFYFAGNPVNTLTASSNGLLSFNPYYDGLIGGSPDYGHNDLDHNWNARPLLAPLWDDLAGYNGTSSRITTGVSPNRVFTIEFINWSWDWSATPGISFQVKLYETSNTIEYIYRQESGAVRTPSASIGLAFANLGAGNFISLNNAGPSPTASTSAETSSIASKPVTGQVYTFTPQPIAQTITFGTLSAKAFGEAAFQLNATASSGLSIQYTSSDPSIASITGNTVTIHAAGTIDITATQTGNMVFAAATPVIQTLIINKGDQIITCPAIPQKKYGEPVFNLAATTTSGLPLTYQSDNTAVVTVANNAVTITGLGTANIIISQAGDANYNPATDLPLPITVVKGDQAINFPVIESKTLGDNAFGLTATSNSGLPITYSTASAKVAITGNMVTINSAGSVTIQATQGGDANYNAATPVERTFCINPAKPIITLTPSDDGLVLSSSATTGNQWMRNGTALSGATNQTYTVDAPGEYKVTTTVEGCQSAPSDGKTIVITDVEDTASTISVVPNPVTADFAIQGISENATVVLYDQTGRQLHAKEGSGEITMSLRSHPAAMYFLKIKTTRGLVFKKIIKK